MLNNDIIANFLGFRNVTIDKIRDKDNFIKIYVSTTPKPQLCPRCKNNTSRVHDYRLQNVKHTPFRNKPVFIVLKKRRYVCLSCGKRFYEKYNFLPKYYRSSNKLFESIIARLHCKVSIKDIAREHFVSSNTVQRAFKLVNYSHKQSLPTILGIDEFKGNTGGEKYNLILTDVQNNKLWDILPDRKKSNITEYFLRFSREERSKVRVFVMDMTNNYADLSWLFPNANIIVDRYHFIRQVYFALDNVRKRVQKRFPDDKRLHFKHCRSYLFKEYKTLNVEQQAVLRRMLDQNEDIYTAWSLKEWFIQVKRIKKHSYAESELHNWLQAARESKLPEFSPCISALHNWFRYIINSFRHKYTNGFTEGMNNNIKVLKRISYGYRNFNNLRNRVMLCFG